MGWTRIRGAFHFTPNLKLSGAVRKSVLTNSKNVRVNFSVHVHSDWPLYDVRGNSHIHNLTLSYTRNLGSGIYGGIHGAC